jgi:hypothetical protein
MHAAAIGVHASGHRLRVSSEDTSVIVFLSLNSVWELSTHVLLYIFDNSM